ncbi:SLAM family member 5-like isoform X2 [Heterodontus francisci]|uniref:SLAM family member 5-like isoform X2 n=1 Tax=Heterodontus francisci TaxID=7792 RepID=UPI00355B4305
MLALLSVFHLLTLCGTEISAVPNSIINAIVGEQVLFPVHNHCGAQYEVTFLTKSPTHAKLATWGFNTSHKHPLYENRLERSTNDSVVLYNVQISDTKLYGLQIDCYSKTMTPTDEKLFDLRVFEAVSKPLMTIICSASNITLSCSVAKGNNVIFHWEKQSLSGAINRTYDGAELVIDHVTEQEQYMYRCIADNLISNASSDPWTIEQCNVNNSKDHKLLWNISTIAAPVLLLVLALVAYICYKIKLTASDKEGNTATPKRNEEISYLRDGSIEATYITRIDLS